MAGEEFLTSLSEFWADYSFWIIVIVVAGGIFIFNKIKKNKAKKEKENALSTQQEAPAREYIISPFDNNVMEREYEEKNGIHTSKLSFLKKRREGIIDTIEKNEVLFNDAKRRYKSLEKIGESLRNELEVLKQDKMRYDTEIRGLENE